jgi:hypothetical protein
VVPGAAVAVTVQGSVPELLVAHVAGSLPFGDFRFAQTAALSSSQLMPIEILTPITASALLEVIANAIIISPNITVKDAIEFVRLITHTPHLGTGLTHDPPRWRSLVVGHTHNNTLFKDWTAGNVKRGNHR